MAALSFELCQCCRTRTLVVLINSIPVLGKMERLAAPRIDLNKPRWDQSTFTGRLKHYLWVTDPRTVLTSNKKLEDAKKLLELYRCEMEPPGTSVEKIWYAKKLYESAYHPDTGDMMNVIGRMSFQVPGGMVITGFMLQFYRTTPQVIFWQWINQSFNALVNYTNRNAKSSISSQFVHHIKCLLKKLGIAYVSATTSALVTALGLKSYLEKRAPPFLQRFVPFAAVAAANCINIPLMRQSELSEGIPVFDKRGNQVTESKLAAAKGITQVVVSRIAMAAPGMIILPFIMEYLEKFKWMQRIQVLHAPIQTVLVGGILLLMTPTACALFPQQWQEMLLKKQHDCLQSSHQNHYSGL